MLLYGAGRMFENFRNALVTTRANNELSRWFVAARMLLVAGVAVGLAVRSRPVSRSFLPARAAAMAVVPFLLAMTLPMFIWNWPGTSMGSWLWSVRMRFAGEPLTASMWLLVGLAIAAGFEERADA